MVRTAEARPGELWDLTGDKDIQVRNNQVLGIWAIVIVVQVLGQAYDFGVVGTLGLKPSTVNPK